MTETTMGDCVKGGEGRVGKDWAIIAKDRGIWILLIDEIGQNSEKKWNKMNFEIDK